MMAFLPKWIIGSVVGYFALYAAMYYGATWSGQANPSSVEVIFKGGQKTTGSLHRAWSGEWVLMKDDGAELHFREFEMMEFPVPSKPKSNVFDWRSWAPILIVSVVYLAWLLAMLRGNKQ